MEDTDNVAHPTCLALCAGIGGLEQGVARATGGLRVLGYVERDAYAASVLLARMEDSSLEPAPVWCGNLEDLDTAPFFCVDILTAGIPCQPFSVAGQRKRLDDDRWIWPAVARIIGECRPSIVFLENVPGFLSHGAGSVLYDLAALGYDATWDLFSAAEVGACHLRRRWFLLGADARGLQLLAQCRRCSGTSGEDPILTGGSVDSRSSSRASNGSTQPSVGRTGYGIPDRMDRLRCLGNAVVPAQAELAFRVLYRRLMT